MQTIQVCGISLQESNIADLFIALNPDLDNLPKLDPKDEFLTYDAGSGTTAYANGAPFFPQGGSSASTSALGQVAWLRKTEYTSDRAQRSALEPYVIIFCFLPMVLNPRNNRKHVALPPIDVSREAQLRDIEASFAACNEKFLLDELRHPNKPNVTAVESYEILPDSDIWANQYDLFRFAERPGERAADVCNFLYLFGSRF